MHAYDLRFLVWITGLLGSLSLVILALVIRRSFPRSIGGITSWAWACALIVLATVFFTLRGLLPSDLMRLFGNLSLFAAFSMMYISLQQFAGVRVWRAPLLVILCTLAPLLVWYSVPEHIVRVRVMLVSAGHGALCILCAWVILRMRHNRFPERFTLGVFALVAAVSLLRFLAALAGADPAYYVESLTPSYVAYVTLLTFALVALTIGFMLILTRRFHDTLEFLAEHGAFDHRRNDETLQLDRDLRAALANRELVLYYQPRIDIASGAIHGVEALVRWNHPTRGLLAPGHFIEAAERSGAILPMGAWILTEAVAALNRWHAAGHTQLAMAVNVSAKQFNAPAFVKQIEDLLQQARFAPGQLELELTESVVFDDPAQAGLSMAQFKRLGIRLSIDDFGTGYSSLSYLKRFPVDCVKIDGSFINDLPGDAGDVAITRAIIAMGHALGLRVVAEGVEKTEQLDFLRAENCDEYQGYLFSRPIPETQFLALLAQQAQTITDEPIHTTI